jgi:hypothetical protein
VSEFLQSYGFFILVAILMLLCHMGHGGHGRHREDRNKDDRRPEDQSGHRH